MLNWLNRPAAFDTASQIPYRLLDTVSTHKAVRPEPNSVRPEPALGQLQDNLLIQGDNLEALKALLPFYRSRVKCIFIDPPYNTKSAFEHYDDNLEHAQWLTMMLPRLQLLRQLLSEDGSIWVTIDDNEGHYLKVLMDEVFGRGNFVANVVWRSADSSNNDSKQFSLDHNHIIVYSKTTGWLSKPLDRTEAANAHYKNPDNDPRGSWFSGNVSSPKPRENLRYTIVSPIGIEITAPANGWRWSRDTIEEFIETKEVVFTHEGTRLMKKTYLADQKGLAPSTVWDDIEETGHNRQAKYELKKLFPETTTSELFGTPKPERFLQRIFEIATNAGDLVLDSFLGSGTAAAVAHKMGRRFIGIEMGDHAQTHCLPRLQKVLDGEQGGISKAVGWTGGGGFRFARLGETVFTEGGLINPAVRFATLAAFVWQQETGAAFHTDVSLQGGAAGTPLIGVHSLTANVGVDTPQSTSSTAYYLLFNGILGDKRPASGNVLTRDVLAALLQLHKANAPQGSSAVVYGEACLVGQARLDLAGIRFSQIPYELRVR